MRKRKIPLTIASSIFLIGCSFDKYSDKATAARDSQPITTLQIQLFPAFNNSSYILVDKAANTIHFRVDTARAYRRIAVIPEFTANLDSFETNTLIDSFYSQSFLDSIKLKPGRLPAFDGLSIYTVIHRKNHQDTIQSGNVYPHSLSTNIISQINYIHKNTRDTSLKIYLEDLKEYLH